MLLIRLFVRFGYFLSNCCFHCGFVGNCGVSFNTFQVLKNFLRFIATTNSCFVGEFPYAGL